MEITVLTLPQISRVYPEYTDWTDYEFGKAIQEKHYPQADYAQFARQIGAPLQEDLRILTPREYNVKHPDSPISPDGIGQGGIVWDVGNAVMAGANQFAAMPFWLGEMVGEAVGLDFLRDAGRGAKEYSQDSANARQGSYAAI
jgi:hypothetical protein